MLAVMLTETIHAFDGNKNFERLFDLPSASHAQRPHSLLLLITILLW
jgi:hypothetical protein